MADWMTLEMANDATGSHALHGAAFEHVTGESIHFILWLGVY